jgi:hypothetical protein
MRHTSHKLAADGLELRLAERGLPDTVRKRMELALAAYQADIDRLKSEPKRGEGKKELAAKAREFEKERDTALRQDPYFDYAHAFLEIAIVLASASMVLQNWTLLVDSGHLGFLGVLLMVNGITLTVNIRFIA